MKETKLSVFLLKDNSDYTFDDENKSLYMTNLSADGQGNSVSVDFASTEVDLIEDITPPNDWEPSKYKLIDNEWVT